MFTLPDLDYPFDALEPHIDKETMEIHHDKHHATYIKNLNDALLGNEGLLVIQVTKLIADLEKVPQEIRQKVRNNAGGHANHSFFWKIMSPKNESSPSGKLLEAIQTAFGSLDEFKLKFETQGLGRFGSGWVWLISDKGKLSLFDTPNQDNPLMEGKIPVLALDVWEHAYYLKYQNKRADYIKAWWNVVNWKEVEVNFEKSLK